MDAALRAIREYYARIGPSGSAGEPYPLLIVRPEGVEAYAAARSAMRNWDDEFGYELVDPQMKLKFPDADPELYVYEGKGRIQVGGHPGVIRAVHEFFGGKASVGSFDEKQWWFVRECGHG